jgi:hypothetical protein
MKLPKPQVERCIFADGFESPLPAMELRWDRDDGCVAEQVWHLPAGVTLKSAAPDRFGIAIHRGGKNSYRVRVAWNDLCLCWNDLSRSQIMSSSLASILAALGTDLWRLLDQAVEETAAVRAA